MNLEKLLRSTIKIAAVALTAPATWAVAGNLYASPLQRIVVQLAALALVEGALLLGWHMLDTNGKATTAQRVLYASVTIVAYAVLWMIAIRHGEGLAGIGFRGTLGVLIGYSIFESGILANIKIKRQADRNITAHWKVKRYRRRLAIADAKAAADVEFSLLAAQREVDAIVTAEIVKRDKSKRLKEVKAGAVTLSHETPVTVTKRKRPKSLSKAKALDKTVDILRDNPHASLRDIADEINKSRETARRYLDELEQTERIVRANGSGVQVLS